MVAFNFQKQFVPKILDGSKRQTFRATQRAKPGDLLQLYCGQRTKHCMKLMEAICTEVLEGVIDTPGVFFYPNAHAEYDPLRAARPGDFVVDGLPVDDFAKLDGFESHNQMLQFFTGQKFMLPFRGWLHKWEPVK